MSAASLRSSHTVPRDPILRRVYRRAAKENGGAASFPLSGEPGSASFRTGRVPNDATPDAIVQCEDNDVAPCTEATDETHVAAARSFHQGGMNAAMMDGSVQFFNDEVDANIRAALGTRINQD